MEFKGHGRINAIILLAVLIVAFSLLIDACRVEGSVPLRQWINGDTVTVHSKHGVTTFNGKTANGILFYLDENKDTISRTPFIKGRENGEAKSWYHPGQVREVRYYSEGKKTGTHYGWYPNGTLQFEYQYAEDEFNGTYTEWYPGGQLFRKQNFSMGHEDGMQTVYYEGGQIKSNYLIKNERRYGLPGTQNCVNVNDSIDRKRTIPQ